MFSMTAGFYDAIYGARGKDYADEARQIHNIIQGRKQTSGIILLDVGGLYVGVKKEGND